MAKDKKMTEGNEPMPTKKRPKKDPLGSDEEVGGVSVLVDIGALLNLVDFLGAVAPTLKGKISRDFQGGKTILDSLIGKEDCNGADVG